MAKDDIASSMPGGKLPHTVTDMEVKRGEIHGGNWKSKLRLEKHGGYSIKAISNILHLHAKEIDYFIIIPHSRNIASS